MKVLSPVLYSFNAPSGTTDMETVSGEISYSVSVNGSEKYTGNTSYGAEVSVPVSVDASGDYSFAVSCSNANGKSLDTSIDKYIGYAKPATPTNVSASLSNGIITITWSPVTDVVAGQYIDSAGFKYTVTRSDNKVIAESITDTQAIDNLGNITDNIEYTYSVYAINANVSSEASISNVVKYGYPEPPYEQGFNLESDSKDFTIIDANNDGNTWQYFRGRMLIRIYGSSETGMNDWLIAPALRFEDGKAYPFSIDLEGNIGYTEIAEVKFGNTPTAEGMTTSVIEPTELTSETKNYTGYIIPHDTGVKYVGVHAMSSKDCFYIFADNIKIGSPINAGVPAKVTNLTVTPDYNGNKTAQITFELPKLSAHGDIIDNITSIVIRRDDTIINTSSIETGQTSITFVDEVTDDGYHTYTVSAVNEAGEGIPSTATAFIWY